MVAFPRTCTIPPRSMIAHGVATGSLSPPFPGEYLSAGEKRLRQSNAARIMMTQRAQCHHGQSLFACLQADIGSIQMESQIRVESKAGIPSHDQQQLVKRCDPCGQLRSVAEHPAAINDPANALGGQRL